MSTSTETSSDILSTLHILPCLILTTTQWQRYYYFIDQKHEAREMREHVQGHMVSRAAFRRRQSNSEPRS